MVSIASPPAVLTNLWRSVTDSTDRFFFPTAALDQGNPRALLNAVEQDYAEIGYVLSPPGARPVSYTPQANVIVDSWA